MFFPEKLAYRQPSSIQMDPSENLPAYWAQSHGWPPAPPLSSSRQAKSTGIKSGIVRLKSPGRQRIISHAMPVDALHQKYHFLIARRIGRCSLYFSNRSGWSEWRGYSGHEIYVADYPQFILRQSEERDVEGSAELRYQNYTCCKFPPASHMGTKHKLLQDLQMIWSTNIFD